MPTRALETAGSTIDRASVLSLSIGERTCTLISGECLCGRQQGPVQVAACSFAECVEPRWRRDLWYAVLV